MTRLLAALPGAIETTIAMTGTVLLIAVVDPDPALLTLGAVLAMTLSRSRLIDTWRGRLESVVVLPALALVTAGVAFALSREPLLGALAFTGAMFLSVWLRRFGPGWRRIGSLIALPFITLLIAPVRLGESAAPRAAVVSLVALGVVVVVRLASSALRSSVVSETPPRTTRASTRMAVQLAVAIAAAFLLGFWLFPEHWGWIVLTAYLVCSGNRGRADVLYKSGLRVLGATVGSGVAVLLVGIRIEGAVLVAVVIGTVAVGLVLRGLSYGFWALVVTLALTLLQGGLGGTPVELWPRVLAIVLGALCGVIASWVILPVRSEAVLRRRIADLLAALDAMILDSGPRPSFTPIDEVSAPFLAVARLPFVPRRWRRAGEWVQLLNLIAPEALEPADLPALRSARRAMREPDKIEPALRALLEHG